MESSPRPSPNLSNEKAPPGFRAAPVQMETRTARVHGPVPSPVPPLMVGIDTPRRGKRKAFCGESTTRKLRLALWESQIVDFPQRNGANIGVGPSTTNRGGCPRPGVAVDH